MEKFFDLEWFKQRVESSVDRILDERIGARIESMLDRLDGNIPVEVDKDLVKAVPIPEEGKPYLTVKLVNDALTVVLKDGSILNKPNATAEHYQRALVSKSREELINVIEDRVVVQEKVDEVREMHRVEGIKKGFELFGKLKDFKVEEHHVYLSGTSRTIPPLLVDKFLEVIGKHHSVNTTTDLEQQLADDVEYQSLKNFFMWCCLNPRAEVADQLYRFLTDNSFRITKQGFFVALRNVVTVTPGEDNTLVQFVSNAYNKVKAVWKKNPVDFNIVKKDNGDLILESHNNITKAKGTVVGSLSDLYKSLPEMKENRFTDAHTRTFDIRVGRPVNMPMNECNWSTADCAHAGLHFTADQIHYVGCGDTSVLVLINPMKVVGIGAHKGRCYEYLPIMTVPRHEATKILHDISFDTLELDEDYAIRELESLEEKAKAGFTAETGKYNFNLPNISTVEINNIVNSLNEMKAFITNRVSVIK